MKSCCDKLLLARIINFVIDLLTFLCLLVIKMFSVWLFSAALSGFCPQLPAFLYYTVSPLRRVVLRCDILNDERYRVVYYLQPIGKGGIVYNNNPWHRDCFCCSHCQRVLGRERFTSVEDRPYCVDCYGQLFAKKCSTCTKPITGKWKQIYPSRSA